jgi:hypothetical protein
VSFTCNCKTARRCGECRGAGGGQAVERALIRRFGGEECLDRAAQFVVVASRCAHKRRPFGKWLFDRRLE